MTISKLGLRYERLLFLAAPLSLVTLLVLLVAVATENQQDYFESNCYIEAASVIENNLPALNEAWQRQVSRMSTKQSKNVDYELDVKRSWIFGLHAGSRCYYFMDARPDADLYSSPDELISKLKKLSRPSVAKPVNFAGVEIPERASIGIFGTTIKIELMVMTQALQIALAPLMVLWLGSLYNTRYRESLFIGSARSVTDVFPHLINAYPVGRFSEIRKKSWLRYHWPNALALAYSFVRIFLLSVFIGPPVAFYISSLYFLHSAQYVSIFVALGLLVFLFSLVNVAIELCPWHFKKSFPGVFVLKF